MMRLSLSVVNQTACHGCVNTRKISVMTHCITVRMSCVFARHRKDEHTIALFRKWLIDQGNSSGSTRRTTA